MTSDGSNRPETISPSLQAGSAQRGVPGGGPPGPAQRGVPGGGPPGPALPRRNPVRAPVLRVLPGTPEAAGTARSLTRELLGDDHLATEIAVLLVSELVTNSITHSRSRLPGGTVTVALCTGPAGVLIQVRDDGGAAEPRSPHANGVHPDGAHPCAADHGYGLVLVAALADTWGTMATAEGRVTWCRVSGETRATAPPAG